MCLGAPDCQPELVRFIVCSMEDTEKKARLAAALRQNLRKRKVQAREQASEAEPQREPNHSDTSRADS